MQADKKQVLAAVLFGASTAWAQTPVAPPQWHTVGPVHYVCGGVSDEGMSAIKAKRGDANSELLFTSGPEGAYLAEVAVTVEGPSIKQPIAFNSHGPLCLLKLPKGSYTVTADYGGKLVKHTVKIEDGLQQTKFNWIAAK